MGVGSKKSQCQRLDPSSVLETRMETRSGGHRNSSLPFRLGWGEDTWKPGREGGKGWTAGEAES